MFNVGDEVMITTGIYGITSKGSLGTVVKVTDDLVLVEFTYIASGLYGRQEGNLPEDHFWVRQHHCGLVAPTNPQQAVLAKIKEMEARRIKGKVLKQKKPFGPPITTSYTW